MTAQEQSVVFDAITVDEDGEPVIVPKLLKEQKNPPVMHRMDIVGRFMDGEDYILNNPPGFAIGVAVEYVKEMGLERV